MFTNSDTFVDQVHQHLCSKGIFGDVAHWCEMRNDCVYVITCPDCGQTFALEEHEYDLLLLRSQESPDACGIAPIAD